MMQGNSCFRGQLLVAMPWADKGDFGRVVVYVCAHSAKGAMGIILNRPNKALLPDLLRKVDILNEMNFMHMSTTLKRLKIHNGGPVEEGRGFVLHSKDYACKATIEVSDEICLTTTLDILQAFGNGTGPKKAIVALGYAGWGPGQLEAEINSNEWLTGIATSSLLFDGDVESQYERCLAQFGVDPLRLTRQVGHA